MHISQFQNLLAIYTRTFFLDFNKYFFHFNNYFSSKVKMDAKVLILEVMLNQISNSTETVMVDVMDKSHIEIFLLHGL